MNQARGTRGRLAELEGRDVPGAAIQDDERGAGTEVMHAQRRPPTRRACAAIRMTGPIAVSRWRWPLALQRDESVRPSSRGASKLDANS